MEKQTFTFGIRPVIEAITSGKSIDKLFIQNGIKSELMKELMALVKQEHIPYQYVPLPRLNRITRKNHQGVIAYISPIIFQSIEELVQSLYEKGKSPLILILDRITDVRNFGAIVRTAECVGVDAIVLPHKGAAQINADAIKTSAGALHKIPVCREASLSTIVDFLKDSGLKIVACTEKTDKAIYEADYRQPVAIIMGSEEDGISTKLMDKADEKVKIPLLGEIASLNVSVATGMILYEAVRQKLTE